MEERHLSQLTQNLIERFELLGKGEFNLDFELNQLIHPITRYPLDEKYVQEIEIGFLNHVKYKRSHDSAVLIPVSKVSDPKLHEEWYDEWLSRNNDELNSYYWKRLEEYLSRELTNDLTAENAGVIVRSIDEATHSVMQCLANPDRFEFSYKGLVVGYVQSGKTANFTALIAKAADAGYNFIIVLSGIHSVLRRQTQIRLDKELTGMNDLQIEKLFIQEPSDVKKWIRITTAQVKMWKSRDGQNRIRDLGEFDTVNLDPFDSICNRSSPTIATIKKNTKILDRLIKYIKKSSEKNREKISLLIIDDEADQASIDGNANDIESAPTTTNERIRTILALFKRKAYVGYTATPFANVLIDMNSSDGVLQDDLYPRNFIISLAKPENYFGASMMFDSKLSEHFIVEIPTLIGGHEYDEVEELIQLGRMTEFLSRAIDQFILSCSIRNTRGDKKKPMSMLVHVSHRINDMTILHGIVNKYLSDIIYRYNDPVGSTGLKDQFRAHSQDFFDSMRAINAALIRQNIVPEFDRVWDEVGGVLDVIRVMVLNSLSEDKIDYTNGQEIKVIAIGGNQLSRGLTLEGLMTSYYLRVNKNMAYDTLLQMGRWFGYRQKYEDLTRIHTTEQIWEYFEHLALVEEEMRGEIYRYEEEKKTPLEMAIAIRAHTNLNITSPNKMGAAQVREASFSNSLNQTIWFPLNHPEILRSNYNLGDSFIKGISDTVGFVKIKNSGVYLTQGKISGNDVIDNFLNRYMFANREETGGPGLDSENLLAYIRRRMNDNIPELMEWSIAVVGNVNPTASDDPISFGGLKDLNRIQRSRKHTQKGFNIGILTEPDHLTIDLALGEGRSSNNPLLLFYIIWKESKAAKEIIAPLPNERIDLFRFVESERVDVLGIAIILPRSQNQPNNYIGQL